MKCTAVITGASSGLGALFAHELDKDSGIDEICLIARRRDRLDALSAALSHPCMVLALDLSQPGSAAEVAASLAGRAVVYLINCAGFGRIGTMDIIPVGDSDAMIDLNCRAVVDLTIALLGMMQRGSAIINVASVAAFQPFQHLGIYAATKAFLLSWSRALHWELRSRGIHVTALCPYWMRGTEFIEKAQAGCGKDDIRRFLFCDKPTAAVCAALRGARRNKAVVTDSAVGALHRFLCKVLPAGWMQGLWEIIRKI